MSQIEQGRPVGRQGIRPAFALLPLSVPVIVAAATLSMSPAPETLTLPPIRYDQVRTSDLPLPRHTVLLPIESGDTLETLLCSTGLPSTQARLLARDFTAHVDPRKIRAGELVRVDFDQNDVVDRVGIKIGTEGVAEAVRSGDGFTIQYTPAVVTSEQVRLAGTIESSFYDALQRSGESPALAAQLVEIFQWDVDFFRLRKGDWFSVVVDKKYSDGLQAGYGAVVAAKFHHNGQTYEAFRFEGPSGNSGYYTSNGAPLRKEFLRAPLRFSRITSGYSRSRFHPILGIFRAHPGIDYGAPVGTPVMATADGTVVSAGRSGGGGNVVHLRHGHSMETFYLHLSRFAAGIRSGARVHQGQIIAYVGATGLATGPHLDYRIKVNGDWMNPLKLRAVAADPLTGRALEECRANALRMRPLLPDPEAGIASSGKSATSAPSSM